MNGRATYIDLPNGKRMELSASIPDIEEVPGPLSDEEKALIEMLENEWCRINAETPPRLGGAATYIKQGRSRVWRGAYILELPRTGAQRRMTWNSASTRSK